jgi:Arc/MetJ-type ribon-helix-helix transcriptional regulator
MSSIDIRIPEQLQSYLNDQISRRGYKDASEFIQDLIEADRHRQVKQDVEAALLEAIEGPFSDWRDDDVDDIQSAGRRLIERRRRS